MNTEKFKDLCDLYGGDMDVWPKQDRHDAVSWLSRATGPQIEVCETYLVETKAFDEQMHALDVDLMAEMPDEKAIEALENKIFAQAVYQRQDEKLAHPLTRMAQVIFAAFGMRFRQSYLFAPIGSLAVMAWLGFMMGAGHVDLPMTPIADDMLLDPVYYDVQAMTEDYN